MIQIFMVFYQLLYYHPHDCAFLSLLSMAQKSINIIDFHYKVTMSETFEKSQMSDSFDVPAGCI